MGSWPVHADEQEERISLNAYAGTRSWKEYIWLEVFTTGIEMVLSFCPAHYGVLNRGVFLGFVMELESFHTYNKMGNGGFNALLSLKISNKSFL